jgi:hypothetical protein
MRVLLQKAFLTGFILFAMLSASGIFHFSSRLSISLASAVTSESTDISRTNPDRYLAPSIAPRPCQSKFACSSLSCTTFFLPQKVAVDCYRGEEIGYQPEPMVKVGMLISPTHGPPRSNS